MLTTVDETTHAKWKAFIGGTLEPGTEFAKVGASDDPRAASDCPDCFGKGWLVVADRGAGAARPCRCRRSVEPEPEPVLERAAKPTTHTRPRQGVLLGD